MRRRSPTGCTSGSPRATRRRSSAIASWRRTPRARIRPKSTTCRCSWHGAPPATTRAPSAPPGFEAGALANDSYLFRPATGTH